MINFISRLIVGSVGSSVQLAIKLMREDPLGWRIGEYEVCHDKSGLDIWIANGPISYCWMPDHKSMTLSEKYMLDKEIGELRTRQATEKLKMESTCDGM